MAAPSPAIDLLVVGSVAFDTIETPVARRERILGGSVSYACAAASFFTRVGMVGVAGQDFDTAQRAVYDRFNIDTGGLQTVPGKTFCWSGVYETDMNRRRTLATELNVFEQFSPDLPAAYRQAPFVFLANIAPSLQHRVLDQVQTPRLVAADTMDLWINGDNAGLMALLPRVDLLLVNDEEARLMTGQNHLIKAARQIIEYGVDHVLIKKGEHGAMLVSRDGLRILPAFPVDKVVDPTGAGDCFAGALMGYLAAQRRTPDLSEYGDALLHAAATAAYCVEDFGLDRLLKVSPADIGDRVAQFRRMMV